MRKFCWAMGILMVAVFLSLPPAEADYKFDDLYPPSGVGEQWMVVTGSGATLGAPAGWDVDNAKLKETPLEASADIVAGRDPILLVTRTMGNIATHGIYAMFFVHAGTSGKLTVDFHAPDINQLDEATTPDVLEGSFPDYRVVKDPVGTSVDDDTAKRYELEFVKNSSVNKATGNFGSVHGQFTFHQNPRYEPSQTANIPFVIACVCDGTAEKAPLLIRATLRGNDMNSKYRDIVAHDPIEWKVVDDLTAGGAQWVLVPVDTYPTSEKIKYNLVTEVTNHTSIRYAAQRYDSYNSWPANEPSFWKFDLPRLNEYDDLRYAQRISLHKDSHIAPGLTTVYSQTYDVNAGEKRALRLYRVDPAGPYRELTLNHRVIFGLDLGKADDPSASYNEAIPYRVQAFNLRSENQDFLKEVAKKMHSNGHGDQLEILVPEGANFFTQNDIAADYISGAVINSFAVKKSISKKYHSAGTEGMLPLHVTFNIRKDDLKTASHWDEMVRQWHDTGDVHSLFSRYFSVYLMSRKDGQDDNPWDLATSLMDSLGGDDVYRDQIKVFVDEDRSVLTVSFIVMLMDGTRDGVRPTLDIVEDKTNTVENKFIVVRDGWKDDKWNLTFYVAESGNTDKVDNNPTSRDVTPASGGGGGGCSTLGTGVLLLALAALALKLSKGWE